MINLNNGDMKQLVNSYLTKQEIDFTNNSDLLLDFLEYVFNNLKLPQAMGVGRLSFVQNDNNQICLAVNGMIIPMQRDMRINIPMDDVTSIDLNILVTKEMIEDLFKVEFDMRKTR